jgi:hypothetical protein
MKNLTPKPDVCRLSTLPPQLPMAYSMLFVLVLALYAIGNQAKELPVTPILPVPLDSSPCSP